MRMNTRHIAIFNADERENDNTFFFSDSMMKITIKNGNSPDLLSLTLGEDNTLTLSKLQRFFPSATTLVYKDPATNKKEL